MNHRNTTPVAVSATANCTPSNTNPNVADYELLTEKEVARLIRMSVFKLQRDRSRGAGIPYLVLGKRSIRYLKTEVIAWIDTSRSEVRR